MKAFILTLVTTCMLSLSYGQDSVRYRVIFIGDAGEMNAEQQKSLNNAANHIIPGKTSVIYLGDNIYPRGMGLPGTREEETTKKILQSQYGPMRSKGAPVFFIPGNHDWDKMGPEGLTKIKRQWQYLEEQNDSLLKLVPANGCPDPVEINLGDGLSVIAYDSEWWLFPYKKDNADAECSCKTKADVLNSLDNLLYKNRHKFIILASHHPFQSYGVHGGKYSWKDHVFPFTALKKNLYIPLPVIGSLYPILRSTFTNREDLKHPLYRDMIKRVDAVFDSFPNMIHVAGHEHGLQFIKDKQMQIVSGAGAKKTHAKKGKKSLFADATQGYVTADIMLNGELRFTFYIYANNTVSQAFAYSLPYINVPDENTKLAFKPMEGDSITTRVHPAYDKPGKWHRKFFGENYRKEWAAPTTLPIIRISEVSGGLTPMQLGGGKQSQSLRLVDKDKKEWVVRSIEKNVEKVLPDALSSTFAKDWIDDITSAQHPFSALAVPPIANAVRVPHANPVIGVIAPDKNLGVYERRFAGLIALLEEREPLGESDNTIKMKKNLLKDNDNSIHAKEFLRARMLDLYLGDWDRHDDQWRWYNNDKGKNKDYVAVPRDRDQVFHLAQGFFPKTASREYILPVFRDFDAGLTHAKWLLYETNHGNAYPASQFSHEEWMKEVNGFAEALTDSVLETALQKLPKSSYDLRHDELLKKLKGRREKLPAAMENYYRFIQKVADIKLSDKNEFIEITDGANNGMQVRILKINKDGVVKDEIMNKLYDADLTKEIRIYLGNGGDSIVMNSKTSSIKVRLIGGDEKKFYNINAAKKKVQLYDHQNGSVYSGDNSSLKKHISGDSLQTAFTPVKLDNVWMPLTMIGVNVDDGFILGAGFKFTKQGGFRKYPYASMHQLVAGHSFSTKAYRIKYNGEWIHAIGKADITVQAVIKAPNNTLNYFGQGNETEYDKTKDIRYYRSRFSIYQIDPAFRWRNAKGSSLSLGPSLYYYAYDSDDNKGRFIDNPSNVGSYDSSTVDQNKLHLGMALQYVNDRRNSKVLPKWGSYINVRFQAYQGLGHDVKAFAQLIPELAFYKSIGHKSSIVLSGRIGGVIGFGDATFYQSAFIGGHENLLGYRQYRYAGKHSLYNNLELRLKVADIASYILPGEFGITGFWDIARVWVENDDSNKWHNGTGGGIYFAPASLVSLSFVMGHSSEGWYPYFTMGFRF